MKRNFIILSSLLLLISGFYGCKSKQETTAETPSPVYIGDNARNNLDWAGTYVGTLPCADCEGIETRLTLKEGGSYTLSQKYLGRDEKPFETKGSFQWSALGNTVTITDARSKEITHFAVAENQLKQLDKESNEITGALASSYILAKVNPLLVGKTWKLAQLGLSPYEGQPATITFSETDNKINGNLSCNIFSGAYELKIGDRIKFSKLATTLKMCANMDTENNLKKVFETADSYTVTENELILNRARMAPLAKFVAEKQ